MIRRIMESEYLISLQTSGWNCLTWNILWVLIQWEQQNKTNKIENFQPTCFFSQNSWIISTRTSQIKYGRRPRSPTNSNNESASPYGLRFIHQSWEWHEKRANKREQEREEREARSGTRDRNAVLSSEGEQDGSTPKIWYGVASSEKTQLSSPSPGVPRLLLPQFTTGHLPTLEFLPVPMAPILFLPKGKAEPPHPQSPPPAAALQPRGVGPWKARSIGRQPADAARPSDAHPMANIERCRLRDVAAPVAETVGSSAAGERPPLRRPPDFREGSLPSASVTVSARVGMGLTAGTYPHVRNGISLSLKWPGPGELLSNLTLKENNSCIYT